MARRTLIIKRAMGPLPSELKKHGDTLYLPDTVWDDLSLELNASRQGALSKPDYDYTNLGLLFPQNDTAEIAYATRQMPHAKKLDSDIYVHVHYIQDEATQPIFKIDYKFYNNNSAPPGSWTTLSTADGSQGIFTYTSGSLLQIATFPAITPPSPESVSANLDVKLYRDDNVVTGDVLTKYVDIHIEIDTFGSAGQYNKWQG